MSADVLTHAVLQYIDHGAFPQSEEVASTTLTTDNLGPLLQELRKAQDKTRVEIQSLSRTTAPDVDTWISRAKQLQADILRSRETAREIIAGAEAGKELRTKAEEGSNKILLLEKEVTFSETLAGTLEHIRRANVVLGEVQDAAVSGDIDNALNKLDNANESIEAFKGIQSTSAHTLLTERAKKLSNSLIETSTGYWDELISVDGVKRSVNVRQKTRKGQSSAQVDVITLDQVVEGAKRLGIFEKLVGKLAKELERSILRTLMTIDQNSTLPLVKASREELSLDGTTEDISTAALFRNLTTVLKWLHAQLPASIGPPLSKNLIPPLTTALEDSWLQSAVPLEIAEMPAFEDLLNSVAGIADLIDSFEWYGSSALRDWVKNAPRIWLTKRREALLGNVRNLVFSGLREKKIVERVETQTVSKDDALADGGGGDEEWDTAWDEPGVETSSQPSQLQASEEDDTSAWDADETENKSTGGDTNDEDAWGWGDGDDSATQQISTSEDTRKQKTQINGRKPPKTTERELTMRETYTVTGIPDSIIDLVQQVISDAQLLSGQEYASSLIAPVSTALYSLPTLALAIYRATAPTAYSKLDTGNMLIYNDASRLSDQLRSWQAAQPPASRLRLDNDVKALDQFAKRAYSAEMESQRTILRDLLDGAQGFSNSTTIPFKGECESAVDQTIHRLREVHRQWTSTLSQSALLQSVGSLLATVMGKMITEFEDLPDIGEAESKQLKILCDTISEVKDLFIQTAPDNSEARDLTFIYCPNWLKTQYLAEIMESSLADIKYLWHEGELSLEFEAEEIVGLIEALFADSGLRRQAISEVRRGGRR